MRPAIYQPDSEILQGAGSVSRKRAVILSLCAAGKVEVNPRGCRVGKRENAIAFLWSCEVQHQGRKKRAQPNDPERCNY